MCTAAGTLLEADAKDGTAGPSLIHFIRDECRFGRNRVIILGPRPNGTGRAVPPMAQLNSRDIESRS